MNPFGHIDLRVADLEEAVAFYDKVLPALGYTRGIPSEEWRM